MLDEGKHSPKRGWGLQHVGQTITGGHVVHQWFGGQGGGRAEQRTTNQGGEGVCHREKLGGSVGPAGRRKA